MDGTVHIKILEFDINQKDINSGERITFGISLAKVLKVVNYPKKIIKLDSKYDFIIGYFKEDGTAIPIIDMGMWIGSESNNNKVIVLNFNEKYIGFGVSSVYNILDFKWDDTSDDFLLNKALNDNIKILTMVKPTKDKIVLILNIEDMLRNIGLYGINLENKEYANLSKISNLSDNNETLELKYTQNNREILLNYNTKNINLVLLVDDDTFCQKIVQSLFEDSKYGLIFVSNGRDGVKMLDKLYKYYGNKLFEILKFIITDVEMPIMDGLSFTKHIKEDKIFKNIPIIIHTSLNYSLLDDKAKEIKADGFIHKYDKNMVNTIENFLDK